MELNDTGENRRWEIQNLENAIFEPIKVEIFEQI